MTSSSCVAPVSPIASENPDYAPFGCRIGSTRWQTLMHGEVLEEAPASWDRGPFRSEAEMEACYWQNRELLLSECEMPGERPAAFYRFELGMGPHPIVEWWDQVDALLHHRVIDGLEADRIESAREILSPGAVPALRYRAGLAAPTVPARAADPLDFDHSEFMCRLAAHWHAWRIRAALAARFEVRAQACAAAAAALRRGSGRSDHAVSSVIASVAGGSRRLVQDGVVSEPGSK